MEKELFFKIVLAVNLVWLVWTFVHKKKKPESDDPAIAAANAAERHHWRYVNGFFWLVQFGFAVVYIGMLLKFIFS